MRIDLKQAGAFVASIVWNPNSGRLTGDQSIITPILNAGQRAQRIGSITTRPVHTCYPVTQPLNKIGEFAVLLHSLRFDLEGELLTAFNGYKLGFDTRQPRFNLNSIGLSASKVIH